jgi:hypothetical protein
MPLAVIVCRLAPATSVAPVSIRWHAGEFTC